jgi:hypothetical protein
VVIDARLLCCGEMADGKKENAESINVFFFHEKTRKLAKESLSASADGFQEAVLEGKS